MNMKYVDLGLPSGKKWAKCNLGASSEEEYGLYFQWGDTVGYTKEQILEKKKKLIAITTNLVSKVVPRNIGNIIQVMEELY